MLQLLTLILISWLLIWLFENGNLSVLGLSFKRDRIQYGLILFSVSALVSATAFFLRMYILKEEYVLNRTLSINSVLFDIWCQLRSVLTEELICRGALLYILIKKIGRIKSIIITSLVFAVLHWIMAGIWGNFAQMAMVFGFTFSMGLLLAYSYARTFSLLIPFSIHFGWNLTQNYLFADSLSGNHVYTLITPPPLVTISYLAFFTVLLLPKITVLIVNYFIIKRFRQVELP